ncbi:MAG TPA: tail fiber protein [Methylocystis sp.]|nr:tail fiber protein [Methylocystis sp.]
MAQPYVGQIIIFAGNFAPAGWMFCEGQQLSISQYETLYNLIGTIFGGDGQTFFNLPDLRGRAPVHLGPGYVLGQPGGSETVTLTVNQLASHNHNVNVVTGNPGNAATPGGNVYLADENAPSENAFTYLSSTPNATLSPASIGPSGGNLPHDNRQPYLAINYCISLFGVYPSST